MAFYHKRNARNKSYDPLKFAETKADLKFINEDIKAFNVIVITEDGENLGSMRRADALQLANEQEKDLVQVSYDREKQVSTAKIIDLGEYFYQKKKKQKQKKQHQRKHSLKQIKFGYSTDDHDIERKIKKAKEFLQEGHLVKVSIFLKGREMNFKDKAREKITHIQQQLEEVGKSQFSYPKEEKRGFFISLTPS